MKIIKIINSDLKVSDNFTFKEYFHTILSPQDLEFDIPNPLIRGMQFLRDYWKEALEITSAYRPDDKYGFHKIGHAVDSVPVDSKHRLDRIADFKEECVNYKKSPLIAGLRARGLNGFGVEMYCVHLDVRPDNNCHLTDDYGKFCIFEWTNDGSSNGISTLIW